MMNQIPLIIAAGIIVFGMTFLETYRHFPKMEKRIFYSIKLSAILALSVMAVLYIALSYLIIAIK